MSVFFLGISLVFRYTSKTNKKCTIEMYKTCSKIKAKAQIDRNKHIGNIIRNIEFKIEKRF